MSEVLLFEEFITLGQLLKEQGVIESGGMAKSFLAEQAVLLNGEAENRRGKKLREGDVIELPELELTFSMTQPTDEELATHAEEKAEEARVREMVKKMNAANKKKKAKKKPAKKVHARGKAGGANAKKSAPAPKSNETGKKQPPKFPGM
jgi:S4 domain protein YaaA